MSDLIKSRAKVIVFISVMAFISDYPILCYAGEFTDHTFEWEYCGKNSNECNNPDFQRKVCNRAKNEQRKTFPSNEFKLTFGECDCFVENEGQNTALVKCELDTIVRDK